MDTEKHSRRNAIALMAGAVPALAATSTIATVAHGADNAPSPVERCFLKWKELMSHRAAALDDIHTTFRKFEANKPAPPSAILFTNIKSAWRPAVGGCINPDSLLVTPPGWAKIDTLFGHSDSDGDLSNCLRLSRQYDEDVEALLVSTGHRAAEKQYDSIADALNNLESEMVTLRPESLEDVRMQAIVVRNHHEGVDVGPLETRWLAAILGEQYVPDDEDA